MELICLSTLVFAAGCATGRVSANPMRNGMTVTPSLRSIDTNCTGCNAIGGKGVAVEQFTARRTGADPADVQWTVSGGDPVSGAGSIDSRGQYTPPSYLSADRAVVVITASFGAESSSTALTLTPGFLQPLTPENAALGPGAQTTISGYIAEAGGSNNLHFELAASPSGLGAGQGSLGASSCHRAGRAFTYCSVVYTAPAVIDAAGVTYVVATIGESVSKTAAALLLNGTGISSSPTSHQVKQASQQSPGILLGASGGNNADFDMQGHQVADCCGGTLGSLVQDTTGRLYVLSNNHVLARSDQSTVGDPIVQPGLIDNNCTPFGDGAGTAQVATLSSWLPLSSKSTNADAAIAQIAPGAVDSAGNILELGTRQSDGAIAAAPPGVSSTNGKGETPVLGASVAKSGRTTGLTCANVSAVDVDVDVDYYQDCAETKPYLTKAFTHQIAVSGNQFTDAGDSGALVVDTANAEPVGLFFAGGMDASGVSQAVASPASDVLGELAVQSNGNSYSFVGGADHAVSCLNYGDNTIAQAQSRSLSSAELARAQQALTLARRLVNPQTGVLGVATGKSSDHPGEAAILIYTDANAAANQPKSIDGVRTVVIPTTAHAVATGSAPQTAFDASRTLPPAVLARAMAAKDRAARSLMRQNAAFFGIGVGQSLDNPSEAALVIYVDRNKIAGALPQFEASLRTRYVLMDRMHVTRSYAVPWIARSRCAPRSLRVGVRNASAKDFIRPLPLDLR